MRHQPFVWSDPAYEDYPLRKLKHEWGVHLKARAKKLSPETCSKYDQSLESFIRSVERAAEPATLGNLTPHTVNRWVSEQREAGMAEEGIASRLAAVKVFANSYLHKHLELTTVNLLRKVARMQPPERDVEVLDRAELERLLGVYSKQTFEDRRNAAFVGLLIATGTRLKEVSELTTDDYDAVTTEITIHGKGDQERYARLSDRPLKLLRAYLRVRPSGLTKRLWTDREGQPLGKWGFQSILRRLKDRSGIPRVHAHLFRHTFGSHAIDAGAERAAVQDMLGHKTDAMTQHYTRAARKRTASRMVAQYSPIG